MLLYSQGITSAIIVILGSIVCVRVRVRALLCTRMKRERVVEEQKRPHVAFTN